ncbi:MAG: ABC transporter substrate-binding protein [Actinomycetaceae bacterium]|nr:ABC transporter substrate-binding protein [Actinomycetaceae bacterium]
MNNRRRFLASLVVGALTTVSLAACSSSQPAAEEGSNTPSADTGAQELVITDIEGREVKLPKQPERIVLGEGRGLFVTSLLDKENPLDKVVAMGSDLKSNVPDFYSRLEEKVPAVKDVQDIGSIKKGDVLAETITSLNPDVLIMSLDQYKAAEASGMLQQLDGANIPYLVTDFRVKPLENTTKSVELYGKVFGKEDQAKAFNETWQTTVDRVKATTEKVSERPTVLVWRAAGLLDCCATWNDANISELVNFAGGKNIGDDVIEGEAGDLTAEKVIEVDPQVIIATGGDWSTKKTKAGDPAQFAAAGYGIDEATAKDTLNKLVENQAGFDLLQAPKNGDLHNIWHQFYNSPLNYVALAQIAKWIHPDQYEDVDIDQMWKEAHDKFMPISSDGIFFVTNK